jgi:hypothetical protein
MRRAYWHEWMNHTQPRNLEIEDPIEAVIKD